MNPWLRGGNWSSGAGAGLAYTERRLEAKGFTLEAQAAMREHLRLSFELHDAGRKRMEATMEQLHCKWWDKPLEEVEEDAQEVCLKEGRACTSCSYLREETEE